MNDYMKVSISGKEVGLKFGYTAFKLFMNAVASAPGMYMDEGSKIKEEGLAKIVHTAYINNCLNKDVVPELEVDDIQEWLDATSTTPEGAELIRAIFEAWQNSTTVKRMVEESEKKSQSELTSTV